MNSLDSAVLTQPVGKLDITIIGPSIYSEVGKQKVDEKMESGLWCLVYTCRGHGRLVTRGFYLEGELTYQIPVFVLREERRDHVFIRGLFALPPGVDQVLEFKPIADDYSSSPSVIHSSQPLLLRWRAAGNLIDSLMEGRQV